MKNFPLQCMPRGWFQVAWSHDLPVGAVKPLRYFSTDLVIYRGESGTVHVMDAHCLHLGAHLGHGGRVVGDAIRCPFHGWEWDCEGRNVAIPYSKALNRARRIRTWPVHELHGQIFVWHDPEGRAPDWQLQPFLDHPAEEYYPISPSVMRLWTGMRANPQIMVENLVDVAHFVPMHRIPQLPTLIGMQADAHMVRIQMKWPYGRRANSLTPQGPIEGELHMEAWGLGAILFRFPGYYDAIQLLTQTPVDLDHVDARMTMFAKRLPGDEGDVPTGRAKAVVDTQLLIIDDDIPVWENMSYNVLPPLVPEEAKPYLALRNWCFQFYPAEQAKSLMRSGVKMSTTAGQ